MNDKAMEWYNKAQFYLDQGDFQQVIQLCQQALQHQPNRLPAYKILGKAFQQQDQLEAAIQCYSQALAVQPDESEIYLELGKIYTQQQRWQDGIISYQTAIRLQPEFKTAYRHLGQVFIQLQQWEAAIDTYQTLIELSPEVSWFYNHLGKALMQCHRWQEAIQAYQTSIQLNPTFPWSYYQLGQCWIELQQWQEAEKRLKQGIQLNPNQDIFYDKLGQTLQQQCHWNPAILAYQKAIELKPCSAYYLTLGQLFKHEQNLNKAIEALIQSLHFQPNNYDVFVILAEILKQQGFILESLQCKNSMKIPVFWIKQYFNLPLHYKTDINSDSSIQKQIIYPAVSIPFFPPQILDDDVPAAFQLQQADLGEGFVVTLENGRVWSDSLTQAIMTSNDQIISDLSLGCPELILSSNQLPTPLQLDGKTAFLSAQFGLLYYHWMLDAIPRFDLLEQQGFLIDQIDYFIVNRYRSPYEQETLKTLGIPEDKIIESFEYPYIRASHLIIPCFKRQDFDPPHLWEIEFLKTKFIPNSVRRSSDQSRIYISRNQAKGRKVMNEAVMIDALQQYGFQTVHFELISVQEQVDYMANADVVIAPHGSGLTNLVFCQPGTKVIEILSPHWLNPCYWTLSQVCQLDYYCLVAESAGENQSTLNQYRDLSVNIQQLLKLMKLAEVI